MSNGTLLKEWSLKSTTILDSDSLLWELCNFIGGNLDFEDCVIYIHNRERRTLVQKAAYGRKKKDHNTIIRPIEMQMGIGIVGHVAQSGLAEIIPDTGKDLRYIVDESIRLSEIAIPIIADRKLVGVLDCESSEPNFFNEDHLDTIQSILASAAYQLLYFYQKEELDLLTGFANTIPIAIIRIDTNQKILRNNNNAKPLIKKWGNNSGYLNYEKLNFGVFDLIKDKTWLEFTVTKCYLIEIQKEKKDNFANVFGIDISAFWQEFKKSAKEISNLDVQLANLESKLMIVESLLPHENLSVNFYNALLSLQNEDKNNFLLRESDLLNRESAISFDLKDLLSELKDNLFDYCQLKGNEILLDFDLNLKDNTPKLIYPVKIGIYSIVVSCLKRTSNGLVKLFLESVSNENSEQEITLSITESSTINETTHGQLIALTNQDSISSEFQQLKHGIQHLRKCTKRVDIVLNSPQGTTYKFFF